MTPELRNRILAEWRGISQWTPRPDRAQPVAEPLARVMRKLGLEERVREEAIMAAWQDTVGEWLAGHSSPSRLRDGVLYVQVLQPTIHYELDRVAKPEILKKLRARFGTKLIREIRFRVG